ncbi:MAG: trypsin-like peptidase domain-containing protein [Litorilinea sp.]
MNQTFNQLSNAIADAVAAVASSVVTVHGRRRRGASGVVWATKGAGEGASEGLVVTANHVVEREDNITVVTPAGEERTATLVGRDPAIDVALLRVEQAELTPAQWTDPGDLRVGQLVLAVARPDGTVQAALGALARVGGPWQHRGGGRFDLYLHADVTMYPGYSGGGLLAADGTLAGINSSALARGKNLTIPASTLQKSVDALLAHGHIPRAYLGVGVQTVQIQSGLIPDRDAATALMIMSVEADTPAAQAGLLQGDILYALHEQNLDHVEDLQLLLAEITAPTPVTAQILRGGNRQALTVELTVR